MSLPHFLPPMLTLDGDWEETLKKLYSVFVNDFVASKLWFNNMRVLCDSRAGDRGLPNGFWHLITKSDSSKRLVDFRRAERLPWARPIIENSYEPAIRTWDFMEGNRAIRTYIWLEQFDYLVILQKKGRVAFLITAYHIEGDGTKRKLLGKSENRLR